jgi:GMP synthase (glutamine-hydrolysing)
MPKPFLILQLRPEDSTSDNEFEAFVEFGEIPKDAVHRIRMEREAIPDDINLNDYSGVIMGGGPSCVSDPQDKKPSYQVRFEGELKVLMDVIVKEDIPFLGACYGIGILTQHMGGEVSKERYSEDVGFTNLKMTEEGRKDPIFEGLPDSFRAIAGHKEACQSLPPNSVLLMTSENCPIQMIRVGKNVYATQFHTELDSHGLEVRLQAYRYSGYCKPEEVDDIIAMCHRENVTEPTVLLKNFVKKYIKD